MMVDAMALLARSAKAALGHNQGHVCREELEAQHEYEAD
jgi:hypothetical protein